jgi:hypothetical protein
METALVSGRWQIAIFPCVQAPARFVLVVAGVGDNARRNDALLVCCLHFFKLGSWQSTVTFFVLPVGKSVIAFSLLEQISTARETDRSKKFPWRILQYTTKQKKWRGPTPQPFKPP